MAGKVPESCSECDCTDHDGVDDVNRNRNVKKVDQGQGQADLDKTNIKTKGIKKIRKKRKHRLSSSSPSVTLSLL